MIILVEKESANLHITGCHGFCQMEPSVLIELNGIFHPVVGLGNMTRIVEAVAREKVCGDLPFATPKAGRPVIKSEGYWNRTAVDKK